VAFWEKIALIDFLISIKSIFSRRYLREILGENIFFLINPPLFEDLPFGPRPWFG
jgi:hypothetical protein